MTDRNMALVRDGVAVNVCRESALASSFMPALAAQFVPVPDEVREGWHESGGVWTEGEMAPNDPDHGQGAQRLLPVAVFMLRIPFAKITAIRTSDDAGVQTWLYVLDRLQNIDLNDPNTAGGLDYLIFKGLIGPEDKAAALA